MQLSEHFNIHGPAWGALRRHLLARIEDIQLALEKPLPPEETAMWRGRIAEIRALIEKVEGPQHRAKALADRENMEPMKPLY